jgi:hypothetical protein
MSETLQAPEALVRDFVAWVAAESRSYAEAMEAWRTNCPRLTIWEDALERGLVRRTRLGDGAPLVELTAAGRAFLAKGRDT